MDELRVLAAHLEDIRDVPVECADTDSRRLELVLDGETEGSANELRGGARDDGAADVVNANVLEELVQELHGRLERTPLDAAVARNGDGLRRIVRIRIDLGDRARFSCSERLDRISRSDERPFCAYRSDIYSQEEFHAFLPLCQRTGFSCIA